MGRGKLGLGESSADEKEKKIGIVTAVEARKAVRKGIERNRQHGKVNKW